MAGLLAFMAGGAAKGVGTGIVAEARARREAAIAELENMRLNSREQADRDFRAQEGALNRAATSRENALDRAATEAKPPRTFQGPDGNHYYENGSRVLPNVEKPAETFRRATPEEAAGYGASAGQFGPDGRFYENNPPSGMEIESDGQGGFRMTQGAGVGGGSGGKLTEQQSKDLNYYQRGTASLSTIETHEGALASGTQRFADGIPVGGNYLTSDEYQVGNQAGREFLASILRKDTGAAITDQEFAIYGPMFLPQPGDGQDVIKQKRAARTRAMEAMYNGLGSAQAAASAPVTQNPGSDQPRSDGGSGSGEYRQRYGLE